MKIEKISENKIKIIVDTAEAKAWNVSFRNIAENTPAIQELFWTAIRLAEENVNFSVDGAKLFVEAVDSDGTDDFGFGMMITRVQNEDELNTAIRNCSYKGRLRRSELKRTYPESVYIYRFSEFENVCAAVDAIARDYLGKSMLYKRNDCFFLYLSPTDPEYIEDRQSVLLEFGVRMKNGRNMLGALNEHGECMISENAVAVLKEYFCVKS